MAYAVNFEEKSGFYHIFFKTVNDRFCLTVEEDIHTLASFMHHYKEKHKIKINAFAIMSNHVHLLLKNSPREEKAIKNFLRDVKREFAKSHNIRYGAKGSLWARSYKQKAVLGDIQLINTIVYILNNPVKAHLVERAQDYAWSSSHLLADRAEKRSLIHSGKFIDKKGFKAIYHRAKAQKYGEGLPAAEQAKRGLHKRIDKDKFKAEIMQGRRQYKRQGNWLYYFPQQKKNTVSTATGLFSQTLTDKLDKAINPDARTLQHLCRTRADGSRNAFEPFRIDGHNILFEAPTKKAVEGYQHIHAHRLQAGALSTHSVIETDSGWALVVVMGRRRSA
jgi:REP element-mobilizing transposase RayT